MIIILKRVFLILKVLNSSDYRLSADRAIIPLYQPWNDAFFVKKVITIYISNQLELPKFLKTNYANRVCWIFLHLLILFWNLLNFGYLVHFSWYVLLVLLYYRCLDLSIIITTIIVIISLSISMKSDYSFIKTVDLSNKRDQ